MRARRSIIPVFVPHLGCPHTCVFCDQRGISGAMAPATPESVQKAAAEGLLKLPDGAETQLAFFGGSFTAIPVHEQNLLLDAALPFLRSGRISSLRLSTRPDAIDGETLERLSARGVKTIELGAQSMDDAVLRASGRGHTAQDTAQSAALIREMGFELILQMMTGLPGSSSELDIGTARALAALSPDGVRIYPAVIMRGTKLFSMWESGEYKEHTVEDAVSVCSLILPVFDAAGVPVIRLGLNPSDSLGGAVAAGAYHPALGELVRSRLMLQAARELLSGVGAGSAVVLGVSPSRVSRMVGQKRENIATLMSEFCLKSLKVREADVKAEEIVILDIAK